MQDELRYGLGKPLSVTRGQAALAASYDDEETITILIGVAREYDRMAEVFDTSDSKNVDYLRA